MTGSVSAKPIAAMASLAGSIGLSASRVSRSSSKVIGVPIGCSVWALASLPPRPLIRPVRTHEPGSSSRASANWMISSPIKTLLAPAASLAALAGSSCISAPANETCNWADLCIRRDCEGPRTLCVSPTIAREFGASDKSVSEPLLDAKSLAPAQRPSSALTATKTCAVFALPNPSQGSSNARSRVAAGSRSSGNHAAPASVGPVAEGDSGWRASSRSIPPERHSQASIRHRPCRSSIRTKSPGPRLGSSSAVRQSIFSPA